MTEDEAKEAAVGGLVLAGMEYVAALNAHKQATARRNRAIVRAFQAGMTQAEIGRFLPDPEGGPLSKQRVQQILRDMAQVDEILEAPAEGQAEAG